MRYKKNVPKPRHYAVVSYKGGCGKTTTAVYLAAFLQQFGPTLLIDGDLNLSAVDWARLRKLPFSVCRAEDQPDLSKFQYSVIDSAARPTPDELQALSRAYMIIPCPPSSLALRPTLRMVRDLQATSFLKVRYQVLLTIVPPAPSTSGADALALFQSENLPIIQQPIRRYTAFEKAALEGVLVNQVKGDANAKIGWNQYYRAFTELPMEEVIYERQ